MSSQGQEPRQELRVRYTVGWGAREIAAALASMGEQPLWPERESAGLAAQWKEEALAAQAQSRALKRRCMEMEIALYAARLAIQDAACGAEWDNKDWRAAVDMIDAALQGEAS